MNNLSRLLFASLIVFVLTSCNGGKENLNHQENEESNIYKYIAADINGGKVYLSEYKGKFNH